MEYNQDGIRSLTYEEMQEVYEDLKQEQEQLKKDIENLAETLRVWGEELAKEEALAEEAEDIQHLWDEMRNEGHDPVTP